MQKAYLAELYQLMQEDERVLSLLSDSGTEYDDMLAQEFPKQNLNLGIAEQNKVGIAAGLASCGNIPFVYTTGAFLAYRALEFVRDDVCLQNQNVKLIGMGSGLAWSTLGPTHHTTEDVGILRALPHLTVLNPASPLEVRKAVRAAYEIKGPVYIRTGMSNEEEIYTEEPLFQIGKNVLLRDGNDVAIYTTGSLTSQVLKAVDHLESYGISPKVVHVPSIKPFDEDELLQTACQTKMIFSVEEHSIYTGLGSLLAEVLAEHRTPCQLHRIGLHGFAKGYGTLEQIRKINHLDSDSIAKEIWNVYQRATQ